MNIKQTFAIVFFAVALPFFFYSCSKDDDEIVTTPTEEEEEEEDPVVITESVCTLGLKAKCGKTITGILKYPHHLR